MFITHPPYEFRVPDGLAAHEARYWRMLEVHLHVPWFMLAMEAGGGESGLGFVRTYCFAWDQDLLDFLPTVEPAAIRGLLCMAPGWKSASGSWTAHEVHKVWVSYAEDGGRYPKLIDFAGREVDVGLSAITSGTEIRRTLALELQHPTLRAIDR